MSRKLNCVSIGIRVHADFVSDDVMKTKRDTGLIFIENVYRKSSIHYGPAEGAKVFHQPPSRNNGAHF